MQQSRSPSRERGLKYTLLNQKAEVCRLRNITLECMVDFKNVHFIRYTDIVALFTNAIDNAIDALERVPEEKRILTVSTGIIGNFVVAKFTNPYVGELNQNQGRFLTTKKDGYLHGIGLSNIKRIIDSYNGVCQIETKDQMFMLK